MAYMQPTPRNSQFCGPPLSGKTPANWAQLMAMAGCGWNGPAVSVQEPTNILRLPLRLLGPRPPELRPVEADRQLGGRARRAEVRQAAAAVERPEDLGHPRLPADPPARLRVRCSTKRTARKGTSRGKAVEAQGKGSAWTHGPPPTQPRDPHRPHPTAPARARSTGRPGRPTGTMVAIRLPTLVVRSPLTLAGGVQSEQEERASRSAVSASAKWRPAGAERT